MALNFLLKRSATASKRPDPASMALGEVDLNYDAGTGGLFYKNSSGGVVKVGPAQIGTTAPNASPAGSTGNSTGEFWYDTSNSVLKIYNGSSWVNTVSTSGFLPLAGGIMTGDITLSGAGVGIVFNDASTVEAISDSTSTTSSVTAASSTAVKAAYDLANGAVPSTSFLALGDLLSGTGSGTYGNLPLGTDGDVLTADSTCSGGIKWAAGGGGGGSAATPTALGTVYGCMNTLDTTAVGYNALPSLDGGVYNTALGVSAGLSLTLGESNVALGHEALCANVEGCANVAVGYRSLQNALCAYNTVVGERAGRCITTGIANTAVGRTALECGAGGEFNSAFGVSALRNGCGSYNVALGYEAGCASDGGCNVFVGSFSGASTDSGTLNTIVGHGAGSSIQTGNYNILLGANADPGSDASCCLVIAGSGFNWLTGDPTAAIKPGAGIIDCASTCGSAGQVLQSTGANSVVWATPAAGYAGYNGYTATTSGTKFNVTGYPGELGQNLAGQLNIFTTYDNGSTGGLSIIPGSNVLIFLNGYNGVGTSTVQAFDTSTGTFAVESVLYPAYTDITVTFTPTVTSDRMNFYIRYLDGTGNGGPGNGTIFTPYLTIF